MTKLRVGVGVVAIFVLVAVFAPLLAPYGPNSQNLLNRLAGPSPAHLLGTDAAGRDVLSRLFYGARVDLPVALIAVAIPALLGTCLGLLAGWYGRFVQSAVMRTADLVLAFPVYVLVLALVAALGPGARSIIIATALVDWVIYARLVRAEVLQVKGRDYIAAARAGGLPARRILPRHILPNVLAQPLVYMMSDVVILILALSSLSFLGVGVPPPTAEWGVMIAEAEPFLRVRPWLILPPGLTIVLAGIGFSMVGDGLADRYRR
ncbi:MAG TPA: ABC transporter permease [Solirubrobacteraceae bacterium]|jgi:peptide/nickel transport system permease protein|nr:ABC transporter permease [Solirubrobacteraceae bacterium]